MKKYLIVLFILLFLLNFNVVFLIVFDGGGFVLFDLLVEI